MPEGTAFGAITILNALATGRGCSLAIEDGMHVEWAWQDEGLVVEGAPDVALAQACLDAANAFHGDERGAQIRIQSRWPHARGLKTSSQAAGAMLRAAGVPNVEQAAVDASLAAGVTLTGAFDDQVAVCRGGCHLTDNPTRQVVAQMHFEPMDVAVWVPEHTIPKSSLRTVDASHIASAIEAAESRLLADDLPAALTANGEAYTQLFLAAGLRVDPQPAAIAMEHGALGAGLSGTGPAVAALFDHSVPLPPVPGGQWVWSHTVGAP